MPPTRGYATQSPTSILEPFTFERREPGPHDVLIEILYCGICHSDIHQARDEWGGAIFPMVPGHEIVGRVTRVGSQVKRFKAGELAGVGCFVDSCRVCESCKEGLEQYCENHLVLTYNGTEQDEKTPTYGGYSSQIVVDENYTLRISPKLPLANVAPLLCAGITMYSPLRHFKVGPGQRVGVIGLGGLGHMAVSLGILASAGPLGILAGEITTEVMGKFPLSLIPTFFVPLLIIVHLIALGRVRHRQTGSAQVRAAMAA